MNARALRVPTIALTVTTVYLLAAALVQHATVVPDVQAVVWHTSTPVADADGVKAMVPKFSPEIVTDKLPEGAAFDETWKLSAGAAIRSTASVCLACLKLHHQCVSYFRHRQCIRQLGTVRLCFIRLLHSP